MDEVPAGVHLGDPGVQFADMNGDGRADLLDAAAAAATSRSPSAAGGAREGFVRVPAAPAVSFGADDIRLVDLDGDGVVDALRTGAELRAVLQRPRGAAGTASRRGRAGRSPSSPTSASPTRGSSSPT